MFAATATALVQTWHDALNTRDIDRFAALHHDDAEFTGSRGTGRGAALIRDWAERAGITMTPQRWFQRESDVVVTQSARWRDPATGVLGEPVAVSTHFQIDDGLVRRVARFDTLPEALAAAGLDTSDKINPSEPPS